MKTMLMLLASGLPLLSLRAADAAVPAPEVAKPAVESQTTPQELFRFGSGLLQRGYFDLAEQALQKFLDAYPDHELAPQARFQLIECYKRQGKRSAAYSAMNQFYAKWKDHELAPRLMLWQGELLSEEGKKEEANAIFRKLTLCRDEETREAAVYMRAVLMAGMDRGEEAVGLFRSLAAKEFSADKTKGALRPYAVLNLGRQYEGSHELDKAAECYRRLAEAQPQLVPVALREEALYRLGGVACNAGDFKQAIGHYERLLVDFPDGRFAREARKRRVQAYVSDNNCVRAVELAREWKEKYKDAKDADLDYYYGHALIGINSYAEALQQFDAVVADPKAGPGLQMLAEVRQIACQTMMGKNEAAVKLAETFVQKHPEATKEIAEVIYYAGDALVAQQKWPETVAYLEKALQTKQVTDELRQNVSLLLVQAYDSLGEFLKGADVYRKLAADPTIKNRADCLFRAGMMAKKGQDLAKAEEDFKQILIQFPNDVDTIPLATMALGDLYATQGQYKKAEEVVASLMLKGDIETQAKLNWFIGWLNYRQQKYAEAEKALRLSLDQKAEGRVAVLAKYYLGSTILQLKRHDEAIAIFAELFERRSEAEWPQIDGSQLVSLAKLFYDKNQHKLCEKICIVLLKDADPGIVYQGSLLLANLYIATNRIAEACEFLEKLSKAKAGKNDLGALHSLMGEVYMLTNQNDKAVREFEVSLAAVDTEREYAARSRWGLAELYRREQRLTKAIDLAMQAMVLDDDPVYTPRAMLVAIKCHVAAGAVGTAAKVWHELVRRYPLSAEKIRDTDEVKKILAWDTANGGGLAK
jgi:tetratricopeptide (TPR) repeat protein